MIGRRTQPLLFVCLLGGLFLILRLYEIQVQKHRLWAAEAARLVHSGAEIPYRRGAIRDTNGLVLARDKGTYELALVYRQFRRGHPLGQVAHARSLVEQRAVRLQEARAFLPQWTFEVLSMSPGRIARYVEGEQGLTDDLPLGVVGREIRARRAADLGYYVRRLLDLDSPDWKAFRKAIPKDERDQSFLGLAARYGPRPVPERELWSSIEGRLAHSMEHLDRLAGELFLSGPELDTRSSLELLVRELEEARSWVEDATASKLFQEAAGFAPGRVAPGTLLASFDLSWIQRILAWDAHRLEAWAETTRRAWLSNWRDGYALPRIAAELRLDPAFEPGPDAVLDRLASIFGPEGSVERALDGRATPWRELERLAVFEDLVGNLRSEVPAVDTVLPFQDPELREADPIDPWSVIDRACGVDAGPGRRIATSLDGRRRADADLFKAVAREILEGWERVFQDRIRGLLQATRAGATPSELSTDGRLAFAEGALDRALERADYYLKDYGMRPRRLQRREPEYAVVYLLTRYQDWYPGFVARHSRTRVYPILPDDQLPLAAELIGGVSSPDIYEMQGQRRAEQRFRELRNRPQRTDAEELELAALVGAVVLHDEKQGVAGVEGFWDEELSGTNGYRENWGLQDAFENREDGSVREVVDGEDVFLTLDATLQRAAERTLREPEPVPEDGQYDVVWQESPVGAICLVGVDGRVLAAASEPNGRSELSEEATGQRSHPIERTLRQPTFQPPGSVFKPFVAAHALDAAGLDPGWLVDCNLIDRGGAGYKDVRCHRRSGHGKVNLHTALVGSCNAYFAALGESLSDSDFLQLAATFGFGASTGVRTPPDWNADTRRRIGLTEDVPKLFGKSLGEFERRLAGNGLGVVDATPMQLARATIALATGHLPGLRLVGAIGERPIVPPPAPAVAIEGDVLERIRKALKAVAEEPTGTAYSALRAEVLGFSVSVKTGSADFTSRSRSDDDPEQRVRKHTWVTGWLPPEDPVAVFVIFMHDTASTSSHGAVYLARQFLQQPEMSRWLAEQGISCATDGSGRDG